MRNERAQVSLEYLLVVLFAVLLAVAAALLALGLISIAESAKTKVLAEREAAISSLLS